MPHRILVCLDSSPHAEGVLRYGVGLAAALDATLAVVHAYQVPFVVESGLAGVPAFNDLDAQARIEAQTRMDELEACFPDATFDVTLVRGTPHRAIAQAVDGVNADLLVMGTHGRTGLPRLVLGSVAERVLRSSVVPVLTLPCRPSPPAFQIERILVPHDFSRRSNHALHIAGGLRGRLGAHLHVVHALPSTAGFWDDDSQRVHYEHALERELRRTVIEELGEDLASVSAPPTSEEGVAATLLAEAATRSSDLIALSASGKNRVERVLLGSVTERVLRSSPVPVLTLP